VEPVPASSSFVVASGAVLSVNTGAGAAGLSTPSINLANGTAGLQFDLDTNVLIPIPLATITNTDGLTFTGHAQAEPD
jgi:hypothetical protein